MAKSNLRVTGIIVLALTLLMSFSNHVVADSGARFEEQEVDGYKVKLALPKGGAQIGHNKLNIQLSDAQGQPVGDAEVTVIAELYKEVSEKKPGGGMDMGSKSDKDKGKDAKKAAREAPIRTAEAEIEAGHEKGEYEGEVKLEETGHWMIKVVSRIEGRNEPLTFEFETEVSQKGPNWFVLSGFLGIIVAVIATAAVTRKKSTNAPVAEAMV